MLKKQDDSRNNQRAEKYVALDAAGVKSTVNSKYDAWIRGLKLIRFSSRWNFLMLRLANRTFVQLNKGHGRQQSSTKFVTI